MDTYKAQDILAGDSAASPCAVLCCRYGKSMFFLGWHEIRQTLFESLPKGVVEFGKKFDRYSDEGDSGVHVHFKVCTHPTHACKTKVTCSARNGYDSVNIGG